MLNNNVELEETRIEEGEMKTGMRLPKLLQQQIARLPRFSDIGQQRAFRNILRFLALMIVFTLIARGTAGATLARVTLTTTSRSEIVDTVSGTASVTLGSTIDFSLPTGLTVEEMYTGMGQTIKIGDALALFDLDTVRERLTRETATLQTLQLQLEKLLRTQSADSSSLTSAQTAYDQALAEYNAAKQKANATIAAAQTALNLATEAKNQAQQAYDTLVASGAASQGEIDTAYAKLQTSISNESDAKAALDSAQSQAEADLKTPASKLSEAQSSLSRAQQSANEANQQASDTNRQNSSDATVKRLDIEKQQEVVSQLKQLVLDEGIMYAEQEGTVSKTLNVGQKTDIGAVVSIYNNSGTFEAEMRLDSGDAEKLAVGDSCDVTTGGGNMYFTPTTAGTISAIGDADESGKVLITITLPSGDWKSGQNVQAQVTRSRSTYESCVPLSAIHSDNTGYYVLVMVQSQTVLGIENTVGYIPVTIASSDKNMAAIEGAFSRESQIITGSSKTIAVGDRVRVDES